MIKKGYIETTVGSIHFRSAGDAAKPHLLLLHQTASSSAMYERMMNLLADDYYIFAPDTPGFGGSDQPTEYATVSIWADATREACNKICLKTPFVFGHHTGASIAVQMQFDSAFARKIVLSGPPYLTAGQKTAFLKTIEPIILDSEGKYATKLWQRLRAKDPEAEIGLTHREFILNLISGERYHEAYHAVFTHEFESQLATIDVPVLVMAGDGDTLKDSLEPAFHSVKNGVMKRVIGNTYICDQSPEVVADVIREFCC